MKNHDEPTIWAPFNRLLRVFLGERPAPLQWVSLPLGVKGPFPVQVEGSPAAANDADRHA